MFTYNHTPHFAESVKLSELLVITGKHEHMKTEEIRRNTETVCYIQKWLNVSGKPYSFDIEIKPALIEAVESLMIACEYDRIYFEAILFDGCFDLYARYNSIIGSRYLGRFGLSELPEA